MDLTLFSQSLRAQPTVELHSTLIRLHTPNGACDQRPYSSLTIHLFIPPSLSIPLSSIALPLSLFCSLLPSSLILSIYPSVLISREASPINLFKQPSEHPSHSNVNVCERASSQSRKPHPPPHLPVLTSLPPLPHPHIHLPLLSTMSLIVTAIQWFVHCFS